MLNYIIYRKRKLFSDIVLLNPGIKYDPRELIVLENLVHELNHILFYKRYLFKVLFLFITVSVFSSTVPVGLKFFKKEAIVWTDYIFFGISGFIFVICLFYKLCLVFKIKRLISTRISHINDTIFKEQFKKVLFAKYAHNSRGCCSCCEFDSFNVFIQKG